MAVTQSHYRFGVEELAESTHGWHANEDANPAAGVIAVDTTFLLRFCLQCDATQLLNVDAEFQYRLNGGTWTNITTTSNVVRAVTTSVFTNAQNTTQRLSGTGTFEASSQGCTHDGISGGAQMDIVANGNAETECSLQIVGTDVADGDVIEFRLTRDGGTLLNTYSVTPSLTVDLPASPVVGRVFDVPRGAVSLVALTFVAVNLLTSTLAPSETAYVTGQTTLLVEPRSAPPWQPPNLLQSTLAPAEAPLAAPLWSTPIGRAALPPFWDPPNPLLTTLARPFAQTDWPVPLALARVPPHGTWWTDLDALVPGVPFAQTDWPLPQRSRPTLVVETSTEPRTEAVPAPFAQYTWPVPLAAPTILVHTSSRPSEAGAAPAAAPITPLDWPLPRRAVPRIRTWTENRLTLAPAAPAAQPFAQRDWPLPRRAVPAREALGYTFYYVFDANLPRAAQVWELPRRPEPTLLRTWRDAYVIDDTTPPATQACDLPRRASASVALRTWTGNLLQSTLTIPPGTPIALSSHAVEVPRGKPPYRPLEPTWANILTTTLAIPLGTPVRPITWEVPRGAVPARDLRTWTQTRKTDYVDTRIAAQAHWELPRRRPAVVPDATWGNRALEEPAAPAAPHRPVDWPVPVWPTRSALTWTHPALDVRPTVPVAWPVPQRRAYTPTADAPNLLVTTLAVAELPPPPADLRVPTAAYRPVPTWVAWRALHLVDDRPFVQHDWPLPIGEIGALTHTCTLLQSTLFNGVALADADTRTVIGLSPRRSVTSSHTRTLHASGVVRRSVES